MALGTASPFSWTRRFSARTNGVVAINVAAVIFGTAALYGKLDVSPYWIVAMRAGFGALALGLVGGITNELLVTPRRAWRTLGLSGLLLAAHWVTFFMSVQLGGVAVATLTFATFPLFTFIVEAAQLHRLPRAAEFVVGAVILLAVGLLVQPRAGEGNVEGAVTGLTSAITYALFWRTSQRLDHPLPAATVSMCQNAVVFAVLVPTLFFSTPIPARTVEWLSLLALGVFNTALMLLLYQYALKRISASTCSGFVALEPVYAIALAAVLFNEPVTPWIGASLVLIVGASLTLLKFEQRP